MEVSEVDRPLDLFCGTLPQTMEQSSLKSEMPNCGSKTIQKETLSSAYFGATGCLSLGSEWEQKSARIANSTQETCDLLFSSALGSGDQNKLPGTYKEFNK